MNLRHLLNFFRPCPPKPEKRVNKATNFERSLRILVFNGKTTVRDILRFANDGTKLIFELRQAGYLYPLGTGETWIANASGKGRHKVYEWTGKLPPNWVKSDVYVGQDRRKTPRK